MTSPQETLKKAIDEAVAPIKADHGTFLAPTGRGSISVARADLHYVFDQYHTQLLDFSAEMMPVGHHHPFVHDAIKEHMEYYMRTAAVGEHVLRWPVEYARALVETFTEEDTEPTHQVLFTEGEREAVLTAIRLARDMGTKPKVALVDNDAHTWVSLHDLVDYQLLPTDTRVALEEFRWEAVCAILISLVGSNGDLLSPKWVQTVVDRAKQAGVTVIIDESRTGFGRLGAMWGQQAYNVDADITVLGGPVGGGLSLGAIVAPAAILGDAELDVSPQAGSPVACCAGAGTLRAVNPGVVEHVKEAGGVFEDAIKGLIDQFPEYVASTYGIGLWRVIEFQSDEYATEFELDVHDHGLLVSQPVGSSLTLTPTLICSEQEIKRGVDLMADTLLAWYEHDTGY